MQTLTTDHPVEFAVDYPDRKLDRTSSFFRILYAIPILVVLTAIGAAIGSGRDGNGFLFAGVAGGVLFIPPLLTILFRQKYPRWWFDFSVAYLRFHNRIVAYLLLLRDEYPSVDDEQAVHLDVRYPDVPNDLNRWMPLVKWILAIPHYIVLIVLDIAVVLGAIAAWAIILVTGRYPRALFDFMVGVMRWHNRVIGYAFVLVTDRYPPFRFAR